MKPLFLEITGAEYEGGYTLKVLFNDGECRRFDFAELIEHYPVFAPLSDIKRFKEFNITDTLEWDGGRIDIAPEYIYEHGLKPYDDEDHTA